MRYLILILFSLLSFVALPSPVLAQGFKSLTAAVLYSNGTPSGCSGCPTGVLNLDYTNNRLYQWDGADWQPANLSWPGWSITTGGALFLDVDATISGQSVLGHINSTGNPHSVTKSQVGLSNVDNYATASQAEGEAGVASDKFMTPQRTAQAIAALAPSGTPALPPAVNSCTGCTSLTIVDNFGTANKLPQCRNTATGKVITEADADTQTNVNETEFTFSVAGDYACMVFNNSGGGNTLNRWAAFEVPGGTVDGMNDDFTLSEAPINDGALMLFVNGVLQKPTVDWTRVGATVTFESGSIPQSGDELYATFLTSEGNKWTTNGNCSSSASPAVCGSANAGSVVIAAAATTVTVNTTAVTANSQIFVMFDDSLGTKLGVTCNTTPALPAITARTAATSFAFDVPAGPVTNPACFSYLIVN